ncbi:MAG: serine/threonine-protein kinase [Candidatus Obscuribacterales bacterium]
MTEENRDEQVRQANPVAQEPYGLELPLPFETPDFAPLESPEFASGSWDALLPADSHIELKTWTSSHFVSDGSTLTGGGSSVDMVPEQSINTSAFLDSVEGAEVDSLVGETLEGRYQIIGAIGRGATATVYKARHLQSGEVVAIKALKVSNVEHIMRFAREVKSHSRLRHKNIVSYIEFLATSDGRFFLVMERVKGISLQEIIREIGRIDDPVNIASIVLQILDALAYAHSQGVIHRDLKSSNIVLVKEDDRDDIVVKILDFGIAKSEGEDRITFSGTTIGSPVYMSPEQCRGKTLTAVSDIYSLGVVAYEMVNGRPPYCNGSVRDIMRDHCSAQVRPRPLKEVASHVPGIELLDTIVLKSLETAQEDRWRNALRMMAALRFWIDAVGAGQTDTELPRELLDSGPQPEAVDAQALELSREEKSELRSMTALNSMQAVMGVNRSAEGEASANQARLRADPRAMALREAKRDFMVLLSLTVSLAASIGLYLFVNQERFQNPGKSAMAEAAPVAKASPPEPAKARAPEKKKPDRKKSRSRRTRRSH